MCTHSNKLGIMRHILPGVVLDGSQPDHLRGCILNKARHNYCLDNRQDIKSPTGDVKMFNFDTARVSSNTITDYIWDSV